MASQRSSVLAARQSVPQRSEGVVQLVAEALSAEGAPKGRARTLLQAALLIAQDLVRREAQRDDFPCCLAPDCDCEPDLGQLLCPGHLQEAIDREHQAQLRWLSTARQLDAARALQQAVEARPALALPEPWEQAELRRFDRWAATLRVCGDCATDRAPCSCQTAHA